MRFINDKSVAYFLLVFVLTLFALFGAKTVRGQMPNPALVGYFHNWNDPAAPYIQLDQVDSRYNVVAVAFATPITGTDYRMQFIPDQVSPAVFSTQIQTLKSQGRKVLLSIGGATSPVSLDNILERDSFIASVNRILVQYDFDGIDIDLEGSSLSLSGGTIVSPVDAEVIHLIAAIRTIMSDYRLRTGVKLLLTMAPETAFVQGGQSAFSGIWGAYLPVIDALRDSIDLLMVQLYNSGSMYGVDGNIYFSSTPDFIVAMTEAVIAGFNTGGGFFQGLPSSHVAVALPACPSAAGSGYTPPSVTGPAVEYLLGSGIAPGNYQLQQAAGYSDLGGMMTWSINWDVVSTCGASLEFADAFDNLFSNPSTPLDQVTSNTSMLHVESRGGTLNVFPVTGPFVFRILSVSGAEVLSGKLNAREGSVDISGLQTGFYLFSTKEGVCRFIK